MTIADTFEHNGYTVELHYDESPSSPREYDNLGFFLGYKHRSYLIGDEQADPSDWALDCAGCEGAGMVRFPIMGEEVERECSQCEGYGQRNVESFEDAVAYVRAEYDAVGPVLPVVMYDHGSVSYSIGRTYDAWDGGNAGLIFATPKSLALCWGDEQPSDEQLTQTLTSEIDEYSKWASGDVYGAVVKDRNGDEVESCWGFIGHDYAIEAGKEMVPNDPPPAVLHRLRFTDHTLDVIESALSGAGPQEYATVLDIVQEARGKRRDEDDD